MSWLPVRQVLPVEKMIQCEIVVIVKVNFRMSVVLRALVLVKNTVQIIGILIPVNSSSLLTI